MPETLYRAIREALAQPLDGTTFERCERISETLRKGCRPDNC